MMSEEFCLVRRHVDVHRAFGLAGFAGEAEVERVFDVAALPAAVQRIAAQHFKEQAGAAAGGVLLFLRRHIAGAHSAASLVFAALAYADAAGGDLRKMAV